MVECILFSVAHWTRSFNVFLTPFCIVSIVQSVHIFFWLSSSWLHHNIPAPYILVFVHYVFFHNWLALPIWSMLKSLGQTSQPIEPINGIDDPVLGSLHLFLALIDFYCEKKYTVCAHIKITLARHGGIVPCIHRLWLQLWYSMDTPSRDKRGELSYSKHKSDCNANEIEEKLRTNAAIFLKRFV